MKDRLNKTSEEYMYVMKTNIKNTKIMRLSNGKETTLNISLDGQELKNDVTKEF